MVLAETRDQLRRYVARERSKIDPEGRKRLEDLDDSAPIFLSSRKRQLGYSGLGIICKRLLGRRTGISDRPALIQTRFG